MIAMALSSVFRSQFIDNDNTIETDMGRLLCTYHHALLKCCLACRSIPRDISTLYNANIALFSYIGTELCAIILDGKKVTESCRDIWNLYHINRILLGTDQRSEHA